MTTKLSRTERASRKTVLFCQACEHEAPVDGEWSVHQDDRVDGSHTVIECPVCGHVIVDQPSFGLLA